MKTLIKRLVIAVALVMAAIGSVYAGSENYYKSVSNGQSWSGSWQLTVPSVAFFQTNASAWGNSGGQVYVGLTTGGAVYTFGFSSTASMSGSGGAGTYYVGYILGSSAGGGAFASTDVTW